MNRALLDHYRCPESFATLAPMAQLSEGRGYFRCGPNSICFGRSSSGHRSERVTDVLYDALSDVVTDGTAVRLPFNPSEIVANLRYERYVSCSRGGTGRRRVA